jgi:hypothetical protein
MGDHDSYSDMFKVEIRRHGACSTPLQSPEHLWLPDNA